MTSPSGISDARPAFVLLGGTGGIGSALARQLHATGARLALAARDLGRLEPLAAELDALALPLDATDPEAVDAAFARAREHFGRLDGTANCVGSIVLKPAHLTTPSEWEQTVALNLTTAYATVRAAARHIPGAGSVVLLSSAAARIGLANHEAIAAAKAGVIGLALAAAATYAPRGLRVNVVAPGLVRTPLSARITGNPAAEKASLAMHALGRLGEPEDVARAIAWLLDPVQSWVTGEVLGVDGGLGTLRR